MPAPRGPRCPRRRHSQPSREIHRPSCRPRRGGRLCAAGEAAGGRLFPSGSGGGQGLTGVTFLSVPFTRTVTLLRFRARSAVTVYDVTLPLRHAQSTS